MALITDPDLLSQGFETIVTDLAFTSTAGAVTTITSSSNLPAITAGDYFEIRDAADPNNNGLYVESGGSPTTSSITATKLSGDGGANPADDTSASTAFLHTNTLTANEKSVYIDFYNRELWLIKQGSLSVDGVTLQALYSFLKEEWKNDDQLIPHPFPFTAITPEQFELTSAWVFRTGLIGPAPTTETRALVRTGGWREIAEDDSISREYIGVITLGSFEDNANDLAYFQQGNDPTDTGAAQNFTFAGPVNEAVLVYDYATTTSSDGFVITSANTITRSTGDWLTDGYRVGGQITIVTSDTAANEGTWDITGVTSTVLNVAGAATLTNDADDATFTSAVNNRNVVNVFLRIRDGDPNGKTYAQSTLGDIGVDEVTNQVYRFPLTNATDLKISNTDVNISGGSPYTEIDIRYFDQAFTRDVDDPTGSSPRSFGIVVDVGTHSGVDGVSAGTTSFTTAEAGIPGTTYDGGTLIIHEGVDKGSHTITTATGGTVTLSSALTGSESNLSFTLQRATPVVATAEQIYEKVQYQLRQTSDIDATDQTITGSTADALLRFVGDTLEAGQAVPNNPNGGGSGVIVEGFDANDTNRLTFYDNAGTDYTYPFVAAGTINFNANLQNDSDAAYWMFFTYTNRSTQTDYAITSASGSTATITSSGNLPTLAAGDYIKLSGWANDENNGVWRVVTFTSTSSIDLYKVNGDTVVDEAAGPSVNLDENPIDSPDAIIVNNNSGSPINGTIGAASSIGFDFDYDNNTQGDRTSPSVANVTIRAIGFNTAQFVETSGEITRATGLTFSLVSALERNYANAA